MRFITLHADNPGPYTGAGNNTYLIPGPEPLLVDAAVGDPRHLGAVSDALEGAPLARVVVTHAHPDHATGIGAIAARWPGATLLKKPWPGQDEKFPAAWTWLRDGDRVPAGDGHLRVIATPGHAPDHVCLFDEESRTLFAGDLLMRDGSVVIAPNYGGSLAQYLSSLERVLALAPSRVLAAHGPEIDDPEGLVRRYLVHRRQRELQVVRGLEQGPADLDTLLPRVYVGLRAEVTGAALESLLAHLIKLEEEGRARRDVSGVWRLA